MPKINAIDGWVFAGTPATTTDPVIDLGTTGNRIDFDTDNDTSIRASADDVLMFEAAATDIGQIDISGINLGVDSGFATLQGTSTITMKTGTAPTGAIVTSSGLFASTTVLRKIIASGSASNVET